MKQKQILHNTRARDDAMKGGERREKAGAFRRQHRDDAGDGLCRCRHGGVPEPDRGDDVYERTRAVFGNLAEQTVERETAEPTVSPTKTPFFEATAEPTVEPTPTATPDQSPKTITIAAAGTIYAPKAVRGERAGGHGSL